MLKLLDHFRGASKEKKFSTAPELTESEKREIVTTLRLFSSTRSRKGKDENIQGTSVVYNMTDKDAEEIKAFLKIKEPELWERNILKLEKGEWDEDMPDEAFKRWKKERPTILTGQLFGRTTSAPATPVLQKKEIPKHPRT